MKVLIAVALVLVLVPSAFATTIVVPDDMPDIQTAVGAATPGDTVLLRPGSYSGPTNTDIDFAGVNLVLEGEGGADFVTIDCADTSRAFYFHSGEDTSAVVRGISIINGGALSGAAVYCVGSSPTFAECRFSDNTAEVLGAAIALESSTARIVRCDFIGNSVLTNGYGQGGAGVHCVSSSPYIADCDFVDGYSSSGGGVYCIDMSHPMIVRCLFDSNTGWYNGGGAIFCWGDSRPTINQCDFSYNTGQRCGGGIYSEYSSPVISECTFVGNNTVTPDWRWGGGGIYIRGDSPSVDSCSFEGDTAPLGGGIRCRAAVVPITRSQFTTCGATRGAGVFTSENASVTLMECEFIDCTAVTGAGIYADNSEITGEHLILWENESTGTSLDDGGGAFHLYGGTADLSFCTLASNMATRGGAVYMRDGATLNLSSSTIARSSASEGAGLYVSDSLLHLGNDIIADCYGVSTEFAGVCVATAECSDIWGNTGGDWVDLLAGSLGVSGNISMNPLFCGGWDVHEAFQLQDASPCTETASGCGQIGAWGEGCPGTAIESTTWGVLKAMFR